MRIAMAGSCVLFIGIAVAQAADDSNIKDTVKANVEELNKAVLKADHAKVLDFTHPKIIEMSGGREKMIGTLEAFYKTLKERGIAFYDTKIDEPSDLQEAKGDLYVVVPVTLRMKVPSGKAVSKSFVIGVSVDKGKTWKFINGDIDIKKIREVMPNLPEKLKLPEKQKVVFEKDEN